MSKKESNASKLDGIYRSVFNGPNGRLILNDMMVNAGVFRSSYVEGDSHGTSYNEGRRSLVLDIIHLLKMEQSSDFYQQAADMQEDFNNTFTE